MENGDPKERQQLVLKSEGILRDFSFFVPENKEFYGRNYIL